MEFLTGVISFLAIVFYIMLDRQETRLNQRIDDALKEIWKIQDKQTLQDLEKKK